MKLADNNILEKIFILLMLLIFPVLISAEDYQYQYFNNEKDESQYLPFSDYIVRNRLHNDTVPHFVEDFYVLYGLKQYYNENTLRKNISYLQAALKSNFRFPSKALVKINSDKEYHKYRNLMFMHINLLIMRSHMTIASKYDRIEVKFYDPVFAKEINESMDIAEKYYKEALPFWKEAQKYSKEAGKIKITTDLSFMESERFSINNGSLNFEKIINTHLKKLENKRRKLSSSTAAK